MEMQWRGNVIEAIKFVREERARENGAGGFVGIASDAWEKGLLWGLGTG